MGLTAAWPVCDDVGTPAYDDRYIVTRSAWPDPRSADAASGMLEVVVYQVLTTAFTSSTSGDQRTLPPGAGSAATTSPHHATPAPPPRRPRITRRSLRRHDVPTSRDARSAATTSRHHAVRAPHRAALESLVEADA